MITKLPAEIAHYLFEFIPITEWHNIAATCRYYRAMSGIHQQSILRKLKSADSPADGAANGQADSAANGQADSADECSIFYDRYMSHTDMAAHSMTQRLGGKILGRANQRWKLFVPIMFRWKFRVGPADIYVAIQRQNLLPLRAMIRRWDTWSGEANNALGKWHNEPDAQKICKEATLAYMKLHNVDCNFTTLAASLIDKLSQYDAILIVIDELIVRHPRPIDFVKNIAWCIPKPETLMTDEVRTKIYLTISYWKLSAADIDMVAKDLPSAGRDLFLLITLPHILTATTFPRQLDFIVNRLAGYVDKMKYKACRLVSRAALNNVEYST